MKRLASVLMSILIAACGEPGGGTSEEEVITTVILEFTPLGGGGAIAFEFDDPDGDGGDAPIVDAIELDAGDYTLDVRFQNRLEDPAEEITEEVADESDLHLVLLTGAAVVGPATDNVSGPLAHDYADEDGNGLPIGLTNDITAVAGTGELIVTLRHMPPEEPPTKDVDTVDIARDEGIDALGGSSDVSVAFDVTVL